MDYEKENSGGFMMKLAAFIVDKRNLVFLLVGIFMIFSLFARNWVEVENDLTAYLPSDSKTKEGLEVMKQQFITYGSADLMVANISYEEANALFEKIKAIEGVQSVAFDDTTEHYSKASALYSVTFDYPETDEACLAALDAVRAALGPYDTYVSTTLGDMSAELIDKEVGMITAFVAVIVVVVLTFTSQTYAEVPIIGLTFITAAVNAVIYCNRFKEEHETHELREAVIISLSKAIPEVGASSLTTIGGLIAMMFMQFKLGPDMAICLVKAIFFSLLSVFTVMPGLLMLMGELMEKTRHRNFVPKVPFVGRFAYATRMLIPPIFALVLVGAVTFSNRCPYVYGYDTLVTPKLNEMQIAEKMIAETFSHRAMVAVVIPGGDYSQEQSLIRDFESYSQIDSVTSIANADAIGGYKLADKLSPRQFAELMKLDYETAELLYAAYAFKGQSYDKLISGISKYNVPLVDMLLFVVDMVDNGYVTLDADQAETLNNAKAQMIMGKQQLEGADYDRMLVYLTLPEAGDETYRFTDTIRAIAQSHYPKGQVYVVGNSTNQYEFEKSFQIDNVVVNVVSILIVLAVLLFTFKSAGMPVLLILVIQGAIWMNFSYPTLVHKDVFFLTQLVVSSIQMGANIDYAIVIANRYTDDSKTMSPKESIIETMNFAFPTILTSGTILATSGILISFLTSECTINGIGDALGRGTIISIILVMFVLPQILILGGKILEKTSFSMPKVAGREHRGSGVVAVDGLITGEVRGNVNGIFRGTIDGEVNVRLLSGKIEEPGSKAAESEPSVPLPVQIPDQADAESSAEGRGEEGSEHV